MEERRKRIDFKKAIFALKITEKDIYPRPQRMKLLQ